MSFDPKCYELAVYFGPATEPLRTELAQHIQDSIEGWLETEKQRLEARLNAGEELAP